MKTLKTFTETTQSFNTEALDQLADKHEAINQLLREGKAIDPELTENFVAFPLHDNPFEKLGL
jgi:hypothetical protein